MILIFRSANICNTASVLWDSQLSILKKMGGDELWRLEWTRAQYGSRMVSISLAIHWPVWQSFALLETAIWGCNVHKSRSRESMSLVVKTIGIIPCNDKVCSDRSGERNVLSTFFLWRFPGFLETAWDMNESSPIQI
jgi:hypothetical protein